MGLARKCRWIGFAALAAVCLDVACRSEVPRAARGGNGFVAVVGVGRDDPRWPVLRATAFRTRRRLGLVNLPLRAEAPEHASVHAQKALLKRLYDEGMRAACVQVTDAAALRDTLESLASHGVQFATMYEAVRSDTPFVHAGIDDVAVGEALADAIREALEHKGTVAVLHADSLSGPSAARHRAFSKRIEAYPPVKVIHEYDCRGSPDEARRIIAETMRRYPRLGGWVVLDNWPLRDREDDQPLLPPGCRMVAVDPFPETWSGLADGSVWAMIASRYDGITEHAFTAVANMAISETSLPVTYMAPVETIRGDRIAEFEAQWRRWSSEADDDAG